MECLQVNKKKLLVLVAVLVVLLVGIVCCAKKGKEKSYTKNDLMSRIFMRGNSMNSIEFTKAGEYVEHKVTLKGEEFTNTGKYSIKKNRLYLDTLEYVIFIEDDYLLVNDKEFEQFLNEDHVLNKDKKDEFEVYMMYYDQSKYDELKKQIFNLVPQYAGDVVENNADLHRLLQEINVEDVNYCYKKDSKDDDFICSIKYSLYIDNYDASGFCMGGGNYFDGPFTCNADSILRWGHFTFKNSDGNLKIVDYSPSL